MSLSARDRAPGARACLPSRNTCLLLLSYINFLRVVVLPVSDPTAHSSSLCCWRACRKQLASREQDVAALEAAVAEMKVLALALALFHPHCVDASCSWLLSVRAQNEILKRTDESVDNKTGADKPTA